MPHAIRRFQVLFLIVMLISVGRTATGQNSAKSDSETNEKNTLNVLFIGNSYTARHSLANVIKQMAEAADPNLIFNPTTVIYGGQRLVNHWSFGTQNIVRQHSLTREEQLATIARIRESMGKNPEGKHFRGALGRQEKLLAELDAGNMSRTKWDVIVLQSYRDDIDVAPNAKETLYAQFAPRFAKLAEAQGARVVLYETTPTTQNAQPLTTKPDSAPIMDKVKNIARLANSTKSKVASMSLAGLRCQTERPDLSLRFVNDAHLNQTMAYLTACSVYAAIFNRSPVGLPVNSVTDIRFLEKDGQKDKDKDRDGKPITKTFSLKDLADLQRIAWNSYQEFETLRKEQ